MPRFLGPAVVALAMMLLAGLPLAVSGQAYQGYTLFGPNNGTATYLVDMTNATVHSWSASRPGGYSVYLLEDGSIIRSAVSTSTYLNAGGAEGLVQRYSSTNSLLWQYQYSTSTYRSHHDIEPMPNGNVLLIAWEVKTAAQAVQAGLDHSAEIWPDHIVEVQPVGSTGGTIVWEWHAWNHMVQDYNPAKDNYGVVANHPELLDINTYDGGGMGGGDWMHINAVSYDAALDQIVISSHTLDEMYVIDHSTTTAQAAGHTGGNSGMGGDILYRWGNPSNYDTSGSHYFDVVHCSTWVPSGLPGAGNILAFNNREGQGTSIVVEIAPPYLNTYNYSRTAGAAFGPAAPTWSYTASGFYSNHLGGCQRLPNGNTLIVESTSGTMFEVDSSGNVEWSYARGGEIARALRYGGAYAGLIALGLVTDASEDTGGRSPLRLSQNSPNPFSTSTTIRYDIPIPERVSLKVFDAAGRMLAVLVDGTRDPGSQAVVFDGGGLPSGIYFLRLQAGGLDETRKLVIRR